MDCRRAARWAGYVSYSGARGACRFCSEPIVTGLHTGLATFGSLLVQRDRRTCLGAEKEIFCRDIDAHQGGRVGGIRRFVVRRFKSLRVGTAVQRLRARRRSSWIRMSPRSADALLVPKFGSELLGSPKHYRMRCGDYPTPDLPETWSRSAPKKVQFGPDGASFRKNANYPRPPRIDSGLVGPHTPTDIQLQVYDIYVIEGYFCAPTLGEHLDLDLAQVGRLWNK